MEAGERVHAHAQAAGSAAHAMEVHVVLAWVVSSGGRFREGEFGVDSSDLCVKFSDGDWRCDRNRGAMAGAEGVRVSGRSVGRGGSAGVLRYARFATLPASDRSDCIDADGDCVDGRETGENDCRQQTESAVPWFGGPLNP